VYQQIIPESHEFLQIPVQSAKKKDDRATAQGVIRYQIGLQIAPASTDHHDDQPENQVGAHQLADLSHLAPAFLWVLIGNGLL
jgi:hypothetical protein